MLIGIDGNEANIKNRVGIGQFAFNVIKTLEKIDQGNSYFIYLKAPPLPDLPREREGWRYRIFGPGKLWTQIALPVKLFTQGEKLDVFYSPSHYSPRFSPFPTVISIMDLGHHHNPEQFAKKDLYQLTKWEGYSVKNASRIVTISEFSKSEIEKIYHYPAGKITVAHPGYDDNFKFKILNFNSNLNDKILKIKDKYGIKGKYFLYLGTLKPNKNIEGMIEAFNLVVRDLGLGDSHKKETSHQHLSPITLVVAGKKGWLYEKIFERVKESGLEDRVVFTGFISDEEKPLLIAGAEAFLLPSFYEGFGIPILEAMSLEVPVITSNVASMPEVGGKAAIYCNPHKVKDIAKAMKKILGLKKNERDEIIAKGREQVEKFSWEKCSQKILKTLENVKK